MQQSELAMRLLGYLSEEFPNPGVDLTDTTDLLGEWFIDSLALVQTVMFIEAEFEVTVTRADINGENFHSVATLAAFVAGRLA